MRALAALLAGLLLAGAAAAQTVTIRSGEHEGFTRLVLGLGGGLGPWQLERAEAGYRLTLPQAAARFDLSQAFRRIGRSRVAALEDEGGGRLRLDLACICHAVAFAEGGNLLVIDIRDGPDPADPSPPPLATLPPRAALEDRGDASPELGGLLLPPLALPAVDPALLRAAAGELARQMGRAATQGLITPSLSAGGPRTLWPPIPPLGTAAPAAAPPSPAPATTPRAGSPPLRVGSALDAIGGVPRITLAPEGAPCLPDSALDLANWGDGRPAALQLAEARTQLLGEFDRPAPEALRRLARLELHLGFGAEVRALLATFPGVLPEAEARLLATLGALVDGEAPDDAAQELAAMAACDSAAALWAVLARSRLDPGTPLDEGAALRAFSALPLHLRRHLGPDLAERLLTAGREEAARAVRDAILRAPGDHGPAVELLAARIALAQGRDASADLVRLSSGPGETGAAALALLLETELDRGVTPAVADVAAAEALAVEHAGTLLGARLGAAHARGEAQLGRFDAALAALARLPEPQRRTARSAVALTLAAAAEEDFLRHAHALLAAGTDLSVPARRALARRFVDLGFGPEALRLLGPTAALSAPADRLLAAEAMLAAGDPQGAIALAETLGPEGDPVAAAARARIGDHLGAAARMADPEARAEALRRGGDWAGAAFLGSGDWTDPARNLLAAAGRPAAPADEAASVPAAEEGTPTEALPPLARARALLEEARATRSAAEALLARLARP